MEKIAIIGSVGYPSKYGGFETLVHHLVEELEDKVEFTIYCSAKVYPKETRVNTKPTVKLVYLPFNANGIQSIIYDAFSMLHALFQAKTFLVLGVSGCFLIPFIRLISSKKIVVNIDGMEWKRQKWNRLARLFLKWGERMAVRWAHSVVTDNEAIKQYVMAEYGKNSERIEYGADHVKAVHPTSTDCISYPFLSNPYAFKVARIEPENNIEMILKAFTKLKLNLVIVGNWNHSQYAKDLKRNYSNISNIFLLDPIYEQKKLDVLRSNCWLYIHGHSAGGTNPSLVEAMYLGLPIVAFDVIYNKETTEYKCDYFSDVQSLIDTINSLSYYELKYMGEKMAQIAHRRYTWDAICSNYLRLFLASKKSLIQSKKTRFIETEERKYLQKKNLCHLTNKHHYFEELD
jgi:glycosyltransferase involved in cell wall biosynthesis